MSKILKGLNKCDCIADLKIFFAKNNLSNEILGEIVQQVGLEPKEDKQAMIDEYIAYRGFYVQAIAELARG